MGYKILAEQRQKQETSQKAVVTIQASDWQERKYQIMSEGHSSTVLNKIMCVEIS